MNWNETTDLILSKFQTDTGIQYDFERWETDPNQPISPQLPDQFIVYFLVDDEGETWTDNKETSHQPRIQVSFFYRNKPDSFTVPDLIEQAFADSGFTRGPAGHIPYQPDTGHYGWRRDFYLYERR